MSKKALIVIEIQNDYFENGAWELEGPLEASLNAAKVIDHFRENDLPIAHIQHLAADVKMPYFQPDTTGVEMIWLKRLVYAIIVMALLMMFLQQISQ